MTICEDTKPSSFTSVAASGDGTKAYLWESSPDNAAWAAAAGVNNTASYTAPDPLTADTYYRRKVTASLLGTDCEDYTNTILVTVNNFDPGSIGVSQEICEGDTPAGLTSVADATGDGTTITYQWQSSLNGVDYNNITSATGNGYSPGALTVDTYYRRGATSTLNGNQCTEYTAAVLITVNNFTPGSIGAAVTICEGDDPDPLTTLPAPSGDSGFTLLGQGAAERGQIRDLA